MRFKTFQDIAVWQKAHAFVLGVYSYTKDFPKNEQFGLTIQLRRASSSICANVVEGYKKSNKEFGRYLYIAQGSLEEAKYFLILAKDLKYLTQQDFELLFNYGRWSG